MELKNTDLGRFIDALTALTRALDAAVGRERKSDARLDDVVREIDFAITAMGQRTFPTPTEEALIEKLENVILKLRVDRASTGPRTDHMPEGQIVKP